MQFSLAELLQRSDGLDHHMSLLAQDRSLIDGPTLNGSYHLGTANYHTYASVISSPSSGKVILTEHKPDHATARNLRVLGSG